VERFGRIVIPTFNSRRWLDLCLPAVLEQAGTAWDVVVVDNASTDGTPALVSERWPSVKLVRLERNIGYGGAANAGAAAAPGGHLLVLNVDTVLQESALDLMHSALAENPDVGVVGPRLLHSDGRLQPSVHEFPTLGRLFAEALFLDRVPGIGARLSYHGRWYDYRQPSRCDFLTGAVLMIRDAAWEASGGFDPNYFFFVEEVDLQRRLARLGWRAMIDPRSVVVHYGGKLPIPAERFMSSHYGYARYFRREGGAAAAWTARAALCLTALTRAIAWSGVAARSRSSPEARRWARMFWGVFARSALDLLRASRA
jgi:GT2 family glycosyltransferase